jgi:hypothetical protein
VRVDQQPETLDRFFRSVTPNTGPYDPALLADGVSALVDRIGPTVLVTHSQAGGPGWLTAIGNPDVRGIVALEPGSGFVFPEGELPEGMPSAAGVLTPEAISAEDFDKLARSPIVIYDGDNIPTEPTTERGKDNWRVRLDMARLWVDAVNRHGGDAELVHLPEIGIAGNTHFLMSDLNNVEIADQITQSLQRRTSTSPPQPTPSTATRIAPANAAQFSARLQTQTRPPHARWAGVRLRACLVWRRL